MISSFCLGRHYQCHHYKCGILKYMVEHVIIMGICMYSKDA